MNPWALLAMLVAVGGMTGGAYWQGRQDGEAKIVTQQVREEAIAKRAIDAATSAAAVAISKIKVQRTTIQNEVQREVSERVVYRECQHSSEQLQRINAALTGIGAEPAGSGLVPRADGAQRPELWRDDAEADRGGRAVP